MAGASELHEDGGVQSEMRTCAVTLLMALLGLTPVLGQNVNQITAVNPVSAAQGTSGLTVTFTLDTDQPPAPPAGIQPTSVSLGSIAGSSVTHASQYTVTALFNISAQEAAEWKS